MNLFAHTFREKKKGSNPNCVQCPINTILMGEHVCRKQTKPIEIVSISLDCKVYKWAKVRNTSGEGCINSLVDHFANSLRVRNIALVQSDGSVSYATALSAW